MKIGIDGFALGQKFENGQRRFLKNLLIGLANIDSENTYFVYCNKKVNIPIKKNFKLVVLPSWIVLFKRQVVMPIMARLSGVNVFYFPYIWGSIISPSNKSIAVLHDFAPESSYPIWYKSLKFHFIKCANNYNQNNTIHYATKIVVDSNSIYNTYIRKYGNDARLIKIPLGVSSEFRNFKLSKKMFFLSFADFSPRKNITRVLEAYSIFIKRIPNINTKLKIIISTNYPRKAILKRSRDLNIEKHIEILTAVTNKDLVKLYNKSICLVYPSLYEGFGLPILEAMACGCPVVTSNYGATKEVSGNAAILVNPKSINEICDSMINLFKSRSLQNKYIKLGLLRSKEFSWNNTALETLKIYKALGEDRSK